MELQLKLYDFKWVFKKQINPKDVFSDIAFQEQTNWWQWDIGIVVKWLLNDYKVSDIIEIKDSINGARYTWILESIKVVEFESWTTLELKFLGVFTALNDLIFKSWWLKTFTATWTPWNLIKQVIDSFNAEYWTIQDTQILQTNLIRYTWTSIDVTWTSVNIDFANDNCLSAINKIIKNTPFIYYIWVDWIITVINKVNAIVKTVTFEKEILSITREISKKDLSNKYYLTWWTWITEKVYQNTTSQTTLWIKEKVSSDSNILDVATQDLKGNEYITENYLEDNIVVIKIKPNSVSLIPLNKITTLNSRNNISDEPITKIRYQKEFTEIYLWNFISLWKIVQQKQL